MKRLKELAKDLRRNSRYLLAFSRLYRNHPELTQQIQEEITSIWPHAGHGRALVRVGSRRIERRAVLVSGLGRLGNSVIQVLNCSEIADALGARDIFYFRFDALGDQEVVIAGKKNLKRLVQLKWAADSPPDVIWQTDGFFGLQILFDPCSDVVPESCSSLGAKLGLDSGLKTDRSVCTIHLRGGDVFGADPHPHYGQPPWAYYQKVLESQAWTRVVLVTEDSVNPCVAPLVDWCRSNSIPLEIVGRTLPEALEAIGRASTLVASVGTFVPAVLLLSGSTSRLFCFGDRPPELLCRSNHTIEMVHDVTGEYTDAVMSGNWENNAKQKALMLSYSTNNLSSPREK